MKSKFSLKSLICLIVAAAYFVGIVLLFTNHVAAGLELWAFSTLLGLIVLWWIRRKEDETP